MTVKKKQSTYPKYLNCSHGADKQVSISSYSDSFEKIRECSSRDDIYVYKKKPRYIVLKKKL